ncbi:hypothetical protein SO802_018893 [Lithocarpus litseifolius]|uniref:F-box domain-containing protein n=1 Tax=Lithocarpus litseifolius TaxID=425828 RepID=A0AAW2CM34_9ROSI
MDSNHEDNPFQKLPDALLLLIFDKILDLEPKTLASCFLVSKHFASLISQTHTNTNTVFLPMETESPAIPQSKKTSRRLFQNCFTNFLSKLKLCLDCVFN